MLITFEILVEAHGLSKTKNYILGVNCYILGETSPRKCYFLGEKLTTNLVVLCFSSIFARVKRKTPINMAKKNEITTSKREIIQSYVITAAKYSFTIDEKKVLSHLIESMQPLIEGKKLIGHVEKDLFGTYHFNLPTSFFIDDDTIKYGRIKEALRGLNEKKFEIEDEDGWQIIRLIEMPKLWRRGEVEFYLSEPLVDVFLNFSKGYSKYQLDVSLSLKSVYSMRLYELISNQPKPITFRISKLKEMWEITEKSYERNYNFIQRIIEPSKKELDEKANWSFTYKPIKKGRSFEWIEFTPIHFDERENEEIQRAEAQRMMHLSWELERDVRLYFTQTAGFSPREVKNNLPTIKTFCEKFNDARERISEIWGRARAAKNPKGYLIAALKMEIENY
jgi:hypothetical protein